MRAGEKLREFGLMALVFSVKHEARSVTRKVGRQLPRVLPSGLRVPNLTVC